MYLFLEKFAKNTKSESTNLHKIGFTILNKQSSYQFEDVHALQPAYLRPVFDGTEDKWKAEREASK